MEKNLSFIIGLLSRGAGEGSISISTPSLSRELGVPQQTVSRWLQDMEKKGLIARKVTRGGQLVRITSKGLQELKDIHRKLSVNFKKSEKSLFLEGYASAGLREGRYYMSLPAYRREMIKKLKFKPYLGTLNLRLASIEDLEKKKMLEGSEKGISIGSYKHEGRTLHGAKCFHAIINNKVKGAVILLERTHHSEEILEIISQFNLRKKLNLKDGDLVKIEVNF